MTALAAFWDLRDDRVRPRPWVERILRGQQIYAPDRPRIADAGSLSLGRRLFRTVPEDSYDEGPVTGGDGRWTLVADVRLDGRDELCHRLGIVPAEAGQLSDAAVVMRAVERWEAEAIPRLIGDFALILWDSKEKALTLARDFLGHRPLHFHRARAFVAVASMPKGLHALPEVPREPDFRAVAEFLALLPDRASFFRGVECVGPGEIVRITAEGTERRGYWNPHCATLTLRDEEYVEATRELLDRAVADRLRGARSEVGSHLSGGLDSSTVTATAARMMHSKGRVVAFTAAPAEAFQGRRSPDRFDDETGHAAAVASLYPNVEHAVVRSAGRSPLDALDRNFLLFDRPLLNLCNGVWTDDILDLAKSRGLKVLLTGEMGNLTTSFGGLQHLSAMLARGRLGSLALQTWMLNRNGMPWRRIAARTIGPFLPHGLWESIYRIRGKNLNITEYTSLRWDCANAVTRDARLQGHTNSTRPSRHALAQRLAALRRCDDGNYLKGYLGGWGIDLRDPTSDRRLVEFCLSIPPEQFLRHGETRSLARRSFADRLPPMVIKETRAGYQGADWHCGLRKHWSLVTDEVERIAAFVPAATILDTGRLGQLLSAANLVDWDSQKSEFRYRLALLRGVSAGHFLRRASGAN